MFKLLQKKCNSSTMAIQKIIHKKKKKRLNGLESQSTPDYVPTYHVVENMNNQKLFEI